MKVWTDHRLGFYPFLSSKSGSGRLRIPSGGPRHAVGSLRRTEGGGDFRKFKPVFAGKTLSYGRIDRIVRELRRIHKENPAYFDVPAFTHKVY